MSFSFWCKRKRIEVAHVLVEIHFHRLPGGLHADLEVREYHEVGERLQFAEPLVKRSLGAVAADRGSAAQDLGAVALGHADRDGLLTRLRFLDAGPHLLALEGRIAVVRGQAAGLEPGVAPDPLAQRHELAEMGRAFDRAALEAELLSGRIVVDRGVGVVDLRVEHLLRAAPRPHQQIAALQYLGRERR